MRRPKHLQSIQGSVSSVKDVSHLSRRAKRRLYCKLQLWIWRKRRERCRYTVFRATRRACLVGVHTQVEQSDALSVKCHTGESADAIKRHGGLQSPNSEVKGVCAPVEHRKPNGNHPVFSQTADALLQSFPEGKTSCSKEGATRGVSQRLKDNGAFEHLNSAPLKGEQAAAVRTVEGTSSEPVHGGADLHTLRNGIQGGL